jgi:ABC-type transport system involved in cytochrome bd biosynthesis fused ATPase/permease subunit
VSISRTSVSHTNPAIPQSSRTSTYTSRQDNSQPWSAHPVSSIFFPSSTPPTNTPPGCGKSTTISLLERFYDASSGHILYNNQDITTLDPVAYRQQLSLVSQEPTLYEGTISANVSLSVPHATSAEITAACTAAQIHDFIASLPDGYATRLGPKGMSLSGGQKQRLSLARALLRNPKLLLLDEATSSLDSESEKLVQEAIEKAAGEQGRTVIAVAHRLATIQKADVIFVMGSGKVLEQGDHQGLLRRRGVYWQMVSFFCLFLFSLQLDLGTSGVERSLLTMSSARRRLWIGEVCARDVDMKGICTSASIFEIEGAMNWENGPSPLRLL